MRTVTCLSVSLHEGRQSALCSPGQGDRPKSGSNILRLCLLVKSWSPTGRQLITVARSRHASTFQQRLHCTWMSCPFTCHSIRNRQVDYSVCSICLRSITYIYIYIYIYIYPWKQQQSYPITIIQDIVSHTHTHTHMCECVYLKV